MFFLAFSRISIAMHDKKIERTKYRSFYRSFGLKSLQCKRVHCVLTKNVNYTQNLHGDYRTMIQLTIFYMAVIFL